MTKRWIAAKPAVRNAAAEAEFQYVCEIFLAEMTSRRARLRQLLRLVALEAERCARAQGKGPPRPRCRRTKSRSA